MNEEELISVIIPVYNIEAYLPRCLETVAAQTYRHLEIILVDDGSADTSGDICDDFVAKDSRAIVLHQTNQGLWAARNTGQRVAKGEYVMFVDGDDYMHLDIVKTLHKAINHNKKKYDIAIVDYKQTKSFEEDIKSKESSTYQKLTQEELVARLFNDIINRSVWNKLYRKSLIENIYAYEYQRAQDFDFNIRCFMCANGAVVVNRKMYFWVQRPTSLMHERNYWDITYGLLTQMMYNNYVSLPSDKMQYGHYLLSRLYKSMVFYKNSYFKSAEQAEVFGKCAVYEKDIRKAYWTNRHIPIYEKIGVTVLLHSPRLTRWLMKVTKNY